MGDTQPRPTGIWNNLWRGRPPVLANDFDIQRLETFCLWIAALGTVAIFGYSRFSKATASWLLCAAAFFAIGMTAGFIFAVPKASSRYTNSNLELISDWLTKILVGVGLTQFKSIPPALENLAKFVAGGGNSSAQDQSFALFVILYFFFGGFVDAYLETRIVLTGAFVRAEGPERKPLEDQ